MGMKFRIGRPIKYSYAKKRALLRELEAYISTAEYPTMPRFCVAHDISKQRIYEWAKNQNENSEEKEKYPLGEYFSELIKRMNDKQESFIEENVMIGNISPAFSLFKLKQPGIGWTDSKSIELSDVTAEIKLKEILNGK